ncbi:uncharacterized protein RBU33_016889 isoform 2-T4 [Hipposideros larvatus]
MYISFQKQAPLHSSRDIHCRFLPLFSGTATAIVGAFRSIVCSDFRERSISEISLEVENIVKSQSSPGIYYTFPGEPEEKKICAKAKLHFPCHTSKKDILIYRPTAKPLRDGPMGDK